MTSAERGVRSGVGGVMGHLFGSFDQRFMNIREELGWGPVHSLASSVFGCSFTWKQHFLKMVSIEEGWQNKEIDSFRKQENDGEFHTRSWN